MTPTQIPYRYIRAWTERAPSKSLTKRSVHARTSLYDDLLFIIPYCESTLSVKILRA
jgi:hypothetical protein